MGKKIKVPQELEKQIIDLYLQIHNVTQIKKQLQLPFSTKVIKRILLEHNVFKKGQGGRKPMEIPLELQKKIIELYKKGVSQEGIIKELNLSFGFNKVRKILVENNVHIRDNKEAYQVCKKPELRKYLVNDNYNFNSHNGAWILGMYAADGYLPITKGAVNKIILSLQKQDKEILEMIAKELEYTGPIHEYISVEGYPFVSLSITSKKLRQEFEKYGIVNKKTFKLHKLPSLLPKKYMIDYIRGFFDGDGSIYYDKEKKCYYSSFCCANKSFLLDIAQFLHDNYGLKIPTVSEDVRHQHINYSIRYYKYDTLKLGEIFYNNNYLALPRKKNKYLQANNIS